MSSQQLHAVKALIYRSDGTLLLQQRDMTPGLPFPGFWTFFGGLVEPGESLTTALDRELVEELGCLPGKVGRELFTWKWRGANPVENHVFVVRCNVDDSALILNEGQAMSWLRTDALRGFQLIPGLVEGLSKIENFINAAVTADAGS